MATERVRPGSTSRRSIEQVALQEGAVRRRRTRDLVATEEPLEIRVVPAGGDAGSPGGSARPVAVTMRTPGADFELAAGFLFTEGLIRSRDDVTAIRYCVDAGREGGQRYNVVNVFLAAGVSCEVERVERNFYVSSSCGVCGKASLEAVQAMIPPRLDGDGRIAVEILLSLPPLLRRSQALFERTGGLHAAGLFSAGGEALCVREDVGRHNAMDKLVGASLLAGEVPLSERVAVVSGRLSFELVQKAACAGIPLLAGVSAPSSLAVDLAQQVGMTLIGFLREGRFNVYAGPERLHW